METAPKSAVLEAELQALGDAPAERAARERRIDVINDLVWEIALTDGERAQRLAREALDRARELEYERGIAYGLRNSGYFHMMGTRLEESRVESGEAARLLEKLGEDRGLATATDTLFIVARGLGEFEAAIDYAHRTLKLYQKVGDRRGEAWANHSLGWLYCDMRDYDQAEGYLERSLELFDDYGVGIARSLGRLGDLYLETGRLDQARTTLTRTVEVAEASNVPVVIGGALQELGQTLLQQREYDLAESTLRRCLDTEDLANLDVRAKAHRDLGLVLLARDRLEEAHAELTAGLEKIVDTNARTTEFTIYRALADVEERRGDQAARLHAPRRVENHHG